MLKNRGIAFRLTVSLIAFSALILLVIFGCNYYFSRQLVEKAASTKTPGRSLKAR